jgi:hypothetical protein
MEAATSVSGILETYKDFNFSDSPREKLRRLKGILEQISNSVWVNYETLDKVGATLTDEEWNTRHPPTPPEVVGGNPTPFPRPIPVEPEPIANNASKAAIEKYKEELAKYRSYQQSIHLFRTSMLKLIGAEIVEEMEAQHPQAIYGIKSLSNAQILQYLNDQYGTLTVQDILNLQEAAKVPIASYDEFRKNSTVTVRNYNILQNANQSVNEVTKIQHMRAALSTFPAGIKCADAYLQSTTLVKQSLAELIQYMNKNLPTFIQTSSTAIEAGYVGKMVTAEQNKETSVAARSDPLKRTTTDQQRSRTNQYCFVCGYNRTHAGIECRYLKEMQEAMGPVTIRGVEGNKQQHAITNKKRKIGH